MVLDRLSLALREFNDRHPRWLRAAYFLCGALLMLSFAPFGFSIVAFLLLQPLFISCLDLTPRDAARHGFWFGAGLFLAGTYWLYISIHIFGQAPLWIAVVLMLGLVVIMGFYYALTAWLIASLSNGSGPMLILVAPAAWVGVEWLRGWFLSGFPWMTIGYGQIDSTFAGFAPVIGVYGVSAMVVLTAAALHVAFREDGRQRFLYALLAIAVLVTGWALRPIVWTEPASSAMNTTIVQGGVEQDRKWLPEQFQPTLDLYLHSLTAAPPGSLVVWPEVAIPASLDRIPGYLSMLQNELLKNNQTLLFGILERSDGNVYNSVVMLDGRGQQAYRKRHLVPFGETFPVPDFVREWMRLMSLPHSDMTPGDDRQPLLQTPAGEKIAVAICYEDAYGAEQLYALPDASVLVNVSNDAWFGDSIAPHQHLEIARMRALEAGRYVVRATNTGISGLIGPRGELLALLPQFIELSLHGEVTPHSGLTPYARLGNWPIVSVCVLILAIAGLRRARPA